MEMFSYWKEKSGNDLDCNCFILFKVSVVFLVHIKCPIKNMDKMHHTHTSITITGSCISVCNRSHETAKLQERITNHHCQPPFSASLCLKNIIFMKQTGGIA